MRISRKFIFLIICVAAILANAEGEKTAISASRSAPWTMPSADYVDRFYTRRLQAESDPVTARSLNFSMSDYPIFVQDLQTMISTLDVAAKAAKSDQRQLLESLAKLGRTIEAGGYWYGALVRFSIMYSQAVSCAIEPESPEAIKHVAAMWRHWGLVKKFVLGPQNPEDLKGFHWREVLNQIDDVMMAGGGLRESFQGMWVVDIYEMLKDGFFVHPYFMRPLPLPIEAFNRTLESGLVFLGTSDSRVSFDDVLDELAFYLMLHDGVHGVATTSALRARLFTHAKNLAERIAILRENARRSDAFFIKLEGRGAVVASPANEARQWYLFGRGHEGDRGLFESAADEIENNITKAEKLWRENGARPELNLTKLLKKAAEEVERVRQEHYGLLECKVF